MNYSLTSSFAINRLLPVGLWCLSPMELSLFVFVLLLRHLLKYLEREVE